jgi:transposase
MPCGEAWHVLPGVRLDRLGRASGLPRAGVMAMLRALAADVRQQIVEQRLAGASLGAIAEALALSPETVRTRWRRYRDRGAAGLLPDYAACGRPGPRYPPPLSATALDLRQTHPGWGAGLIRLALADRFPGQPLPHEATLRRWFRQAGLTRPPQSPRPPDPPRATQPHQRWHLDASEQVRLVDGSRVSWLAASDEATGALLGAVVFPLRPLDRLTVPNCTPVWRIRDAHGQLIRQQPARELQRQRLRALAVSRRRPDRRQRAKARAHASG